VLGFRVRVEVRSIVAFDMLLHGLDGPLYTELISSLERKLSAEVTLTSLLQTRKLSTIDDRGQTNRVSTLTLNPNCSPNTEQVFSKVLESQSGC